MTGGVRVSDIPISASEEDVWGRPRSGDIVGPVGRHGWAGVWFGCPECDYKERGLPGGLLLHDYCPHDGEPLRKVTGSADGTDGAGQG